MMPTGKWIHVDVDTSDRIVVLPMGTGERPQTGTVRAAGPACWNEIQPGRRILFQKNTVEEVEVDGVKLMLVHEDHVLGIL